MIRHTLRNGKVNWVMANAVKTSERAPVTGLSVSDLAVFLGFGTFISASETTMLQVFMDSAIEMLVKFSGYEPSEVTYSMRYDRHPMSVRETYGIFSEGEYSEWIQIPRRPIKSVDEVRLSGDVVVDYDTDLLSNPPRLALNSFSITLSNVSFAEIEIDVTCGPDGDVNPTFVTAALMLSSFLYNNRGCGAKSPISDSGAAGIIRPLKVAIGGL